MKAGGDRRAFGESKHLGSLTVVAAMVAVVLFAILAPLAGASPKKAKANLFDVGAAVVDITPTADHPQFLGGYDNMDVPTAVAHDPLQVRAFFVGKGRNAVCFVIADTPGWFASYQEGPYGAVDAANEAARALRKRGYKAPDGSVIVSSTHSHSAPTLMGLWGATETDYLKRVHAAAVLAVAQAEKKTRKATLWSSNGDVASLLNQNVQGTDHPDGWNADSVMPVLWARAPKSGATVGTYVNIPIHADQYRGSKWSMMSADTPGNVRARLDQAMGGTAVVAMGTLGRQESLGADNDYPEVDQQGRFITNQVYRALGNARPIKGTRLAGTYTHFYTHATNPELLAAIRLNENGFQCFDGDCTVDRSLDPPFMLNDNTDSVGTYVSVVRIGDLAYVSEPGEAFPEVSKAIRNSIRGMRSVNVVGMAYDELGYYWPTGHYTEADFASSDFDKYNISPDLAQESVDAATASAKRIGLKTAPATAAPDHLVPNALSLPGVQFYPTIVESADPTVEFYPSARKASLPPESGDPARSISQIAWDFGDGTTANSDPSIRFPHTFPGPGTYDVRATVTGELGQNRSWSQVVVINDPPIAKVKVKRSARKVFVSAAVAGGSGKAISARWTKCGKSATIAGTTRIFNRRRKKSRVCLSGSFVDGAGNVVTLSKKRIAIPQLKERPRN